MIFIIAFLGLIILKKLLKFKKIKLKNNKPTADVSTTRISA